MIQIDSFNLIENPNQFSIEVLKKQSGLIGGFGKFRIPDKEEKKHYTNDVADMLVSKIWNREIENLKKKN